MQVVQTHNAKGKQKKKARNVLKMGVSDVDKYKLALTNPFSEAALGVRVPDQYFAPTATLALREVVTLTNNVSGQMDAVLLPSVVLPAFSFRGSISGGSALTLPSTTSFSNGMVYNDPAQLYGKITNHRIVSWGARIRNTSQLTNSSGILTVALFPIKDKARIPHNLSVGGQIAFGTAANNETAATYLDMLGLPKTGTGDAARLDLTALLDFPFHARYQGVQLSEQTFEVHPKIVTPQAMGFRNSADNAWGTDINDQTSAVYIQSGDSTYLSCDGWTGIAVGFTGGSGSAGTNSLDIELVYHIEGSPNVTASSVFVVDAPVSIHAPMAAMVAQAALNSAPPFVKVAGAAMAALREFSGA